MTMKYRNARYDYCIFYFRGDFKLGKMYLIVVVIGVVQRLKYNFPDPRVLIIRVLKPYLTIRRLAWNKFIAIVKGAGKIY